MILRLIIIVTQEFETHQSIFCPEDGGFTPALNYYRAAIRGYNAVDEARIVAPENTTSLPTQFIGGTADPLIILPVANAATKAFAPHATLQNVSAGHWMHLEKPAQINHLLGAFFKGVLKPIKNLTGCTVEKRKRL